MSEYPTDSWDLLQALFKTALEKEAGEQRDSFLAEACGGDDELRRRLEDLIEAHETVGAGAETAELTNPGDANDSAEVLVGRRVGRYVLGDVLGEGGFAVVYRAEQQEPVRRAVAMKILKPGMGRRDVIARFEAERHALARMSHTNVAKVFDAGSIDSGRPYFVLEYVPGLPITEYCDAQRRTIAQRLRLFVAVCRAVQHAHQRGVIHRDIKPSNVLVTMEDGEAIPKVIDFGIAKAIGQPLGEKTLVTEHGTLIGTLAYMSPEQLGTNGEDVDTRSDVYSLGVLLYELLTGTLPFKLASLRQQGLLKMIRHLSEVEPPRCGARLEALGEEKAAVAAERRAAEPAALIRDLRRELEWIPLKALEKDKSRRYDSPADLAADIENYLHHRPLQSGPPDLAYVAHKLLRRHRVLVAAAAAVLLALIVGAIGTGTGVVSSLRAGKRAQEEAEVAVAVRGFLARTLEQASPEAGGPDTTVIEVLEHGESLIDEQFETRPRIRLELHRTYGSVFRSLNDFARGERHTREALRLARAHLEPDDPRVRELLLDLGTVMLDLGRDHEASRLFQEAQARLDSDDPRESLTERADIELHAGYAAHNLGDYDPAEYHYGRALLLFGVPAGESSEQAICMDLLGRLLVDRGELTRAEPHVREALIMKRRIDGDRSVAAAFSLLTVGYLEYARRDLDAAVRSYRQARDMYRELHAQAEDKFSIEIASMELAGVLEDASAMGPAEPADAAESSWSPERLGDDRWIAAVNLRNRARLLYRHGRPDLGDDRFERSVAIDRGMEGVGRVLSEAHTRTVWARLLHESGKLDRADDQLRQALALIRGLREEDRAGMVPILVGSGRLDLDLGRAESAATHLLEALRLRRREFGTDAWPLAMTELTCGECLLRCEGRADEAATLLHHARGVLEEALDPSHPGAIAARVALADD